MGSWPRHESNCMTTVWYRYEEKVYAPPLDEFERPCGTGRVELVRLEYPVVKVTPKGVRLAWGQSFVRRDARKRFACPTDEEARESYRARKAKQIRILRRQIAQAEEGLRLLEKREVRT